jgi:hypothetical protein
VKPAAGHRLLAYSSPEAVQTTGTVAIPLYLAVEIGDREGLGKFHPAIALDLSDDVVGRGIEVRPAAMTLEFIRIPSDALPPPP